VGWCFGHPSAFVSSRPVYRLRPGIVEVFVAVLAVALIGGPQPGFPRRTA
jgi:hypothetical protein